MKESLAVGLALFAVPEFLYVLTQRYVSFSFKLKKAQIYVHGVFGRVRRRVCLATMNKHAESACVCLKIKCYSNQHLDLKLRRTVFDNNALHRKHLDLAFARVCFEHDVYFQFD